MCDNEVGKEEEEEDVVGDAVVEEEEEKFPVLMSRQTSISRQRRLWDKYQTLYVRFSWVLEIRAKDSYKNVLQTRFGEKSHRDKFPLPSVETCLCREEGERRIYK